jgi:hypothetical protein
MQETEARLALRKPDYQPWDKSISLRADLVVDVTLVPRPRTRPAPTTRPASPHGKDSLEEPNWGK